MRTLILLLFASAALLAQNTPPSGGGVAGYSGSGAPTNPCPSTNAIYSDTSGLTSYLCPLSGSNWIGPLGTTGTVSFSGLTGGTNTTAAMVVGSGASLSFSGTGTINAKTLNGSPITAFLLAANNLSDLANAGTARTNLGLGTAATQPSTAFLLVSNNLSDLNSASTARTNLGLGTAAVVNTGTSGGTVPLLNAVNTWAAQQNFTGGTCSGTSCPAVTAGTGGVWACPEGTAPSVGFPAANVDGFYCSGTGHRILMSLNNDTASQIARYVDTLAVFAAGALANGSAATTQSQGDNSTKVATTAYTDLAVANAVAGVNPAVAVLAASTANLTGTYSNGVSGIGATFTITATGTFSLDGIAINTIGQRVLLKNQSSAFQNGIYTATVVGALAVSPVFTRALDYDTPSNINSTGAIPVQSGTVNATTSWLLTSSVTTVGTDALTYVQFSIAPSGLATLAGNNSFAGINTFTTQSASDNSTRAATTAYVDGKITYTNPQVNTSSSLGTSTGSGLYIPGTSLTAGSVYYMASGGLTTAKSDASGTLPGVCIAITTTACEYSGVYRFSGSQSWTAGNIVYVSDASAGALVTTAPTTSGHFVQRVGIALANDTLLIMPSLDVGGIQ